MPRAATFPSDGPLLVLEAATAAGSVALLGRDGTGRPRHLLAERSVAMGGGREDRLTPAVSALLAEAGVSVTGLSAVACGSGPGSFTSLRIAGALAKGLAVGLGLPILAIPSLVLAVPGARGAPSREGRYLVTADALRGELFAQGARVDAGGDVHVAGPAVRGTPAQVDLLAAGSTRVVVDAIATVPRAGAARWLTGWTGFGPVSLDDWEPDYGRLAEAQVQWEAAHGRPLPAT